MFDYGLLSGLWNPVCRISSAILNTLDIYLNSLVIFFLNMSPAGITPNSNCMYLYLPNGQENVVKYEDFSSYFKLALIAVRYLIPPSLSKTSFIVGPLCMGLISNLLSLSGSRQSHLTICFWDSEKVVAPLWHLVHTQGYSAAFVDILALP